QGRADEFARKAAGERKQVLGEILGLSAYDDYEQKARERVRQLEDETLRLHGEITAIEQELKEKPQREAELERCEREFAQVDAKLREAEAALQMLRDEKRERDDDLNELLKRSVKLSSEQSRLDHAIRESRQLLEFQLSNAEDKLAALATQIADAEARVPELASARLRLAALNEKEEQRERHR